MEIKTSEDGGLAPVAEEILTSDTGMEATAMGDAAQQAPQSL
jgi:hypothetical protein